MNDLGDTGMVGVLRRAPTTASRPLAATRSDGATCPPSTGDRSPLTAHRSPLTDHRSPLTLLRRGFTLLELLVVIGIMALISAILVANYFNLTRAASYTAAQTDVTNALLLARQRACMDGSSVFFMLIDTNSYVLVHDAGALTADGASAAADPSLKCHGSHSILRDAYSDIDVSFAQQVFQGTNNADFVSGRRIWNMVRNDSAVLCKVAPEQEAKPDLVGGGNYVRPVCVMTAAIASGDLDKWKEGDRYGFELYPRQVLPKGFYFGLQEKTTAPSHDRIVFKPDGSCELALGSSAPVSTTINLYIIEKISANRSKEVTITIQSTAEITVTNPGD